MRILLLTLYYPPDPAANSVIVGYLAQGLADAGHEVNVVCAFPHYDINRIWPTYRGKLVQHERMSRIAVHRVWLYVPAHKANLLGRLFGYISFNALSTLIGLFVPRPDVIIAPSPPLTIGLSAWFLGLVRRAPYIYNVQDIYPDVAVHIGALTNRHAIAIFAWMERFVYRHAQAITVISEGFRRNLLDKGVPESKLVLIANPVDTEFVSPRTKDNAFARREGLVDRFVVLFAGNVGLSQGLESVLEAARQLSGHERILFLIVGNGAAKPELERLAASAGLRNVRFLDFQPREILPEIYGAADVCLVPLRRGIAFASVPSKALTCMAAARAIVASVDPQSDIWYIIQQAACGVCIPPEDPQALAQSILELYQDDTRRAYMGENGRRYVLAHSTPQIMVQHYDDLLRRLAF